MKHKKVSNPKLVELNQDNVDVRKLRRVIFDDLPEEHLLPHFYFDEDERSRKTEIVRIIFDDDELDDDYECYTTIEVYAE